LKESIIENYAFRVGDSDVTVNRFFDDP